MAVDRESQVQQTAREILALTHQSKPSVLSSERWQGEMMDWAMSDERLKVEMLRFVDVFPTLRSRSEIARHLREYFARQGVAAPTALRWGVNLAAPRSPVAPLASAVIRKQMKGFARRFIVGRDAADATGALRGLRRDGMGFTLDVLGEASVSEAEAEAYQQTYLGLIDGLADEARSWPAVPVVDDSAWGPLPRVDLSLKITSLYSQIDPVDFEGSVAAVKERLRPIVRRAMADGAALTLDLEQFRYRDLTFEVFTSLLDEEEFRAYDDAGAVVQAYLRDAEQDVARLLAWAKDHDRRFHLRLVKGAYWDYETVIAAQEGWPVPVFTHKPDTDAMYEKLAETMLRDPEHVRPAFASHNVRSLAAAIVTARDLGLADSAFEIQALHGMGEPIKHAVRALGLRLREYAPVGELIPGMAYLVRRLLENTANDSFLRQTFVEGAAVEELIQAPAVSADFGREPHASPDDRADRPGGAGALHEPAARRLLAARGPRRLRRRARRGARQARRALSARHRRARDRHGQAAHVGGPGEAGRGHRHGRLRRPCRSRGRGRRGQGGAPGVARRAGARARRRALPRRRADATGGPRALRPHDARGGQDAPRGERRRRRGDRLPRVLRARDAARSTSSAAWEASPASTTSTSTSRAASPSSSLRGTFPSRSSPA